ncbi:hypothetical protein LAJ19_20560 (plasmid) [Deinococcus taeanensis]|uniref:hypothetical protein n=1 Tax=Deinococcus taeanensis TaxID=2737050 RepID=UPI001CDB759F|nr:hypothetical protein [Deinococcus taeanensis]UBV45203.1 hypothetical protein LAJ19_20560 [Deinococcus taeanensis]
MIQPTTPQVSTPRQLVLPPAQQTAFEQFGDAWMRLRAHEQAAAAGDGASVSHHTALRAVQGAAQALREAILNGDGITPPCEPPPAHDGVTVTLTLPLSRLPGVTAGLVHEALASVLDESAFTVTGEGDARCPTDPFELGRLASRFLSEEQDPDLFGDALDVLGATLAEHGKRLRLQGYAAHPEQALAGWAADDGHLKHGRLKPY